MDNVINANKVHLFDNAGVLRISLDAGSGDGFACISIFGNQKQMIQISVQPDGSLNLLMIGNNRTTTATIGITDANDARLELTDNNGKIGTLLGDDMFCKSTENTENNKHHSLYLFKEGEVEWTSNKNKPTS